MRLFFVSLWDIGLYYMRLYVCVRRRQNTWRKRPNFRPEFRVIYEAKWKISLENTSCLLKLHFSDELADFFPIFTDNAHLRNI